MPTELSKYRYPAAPRHADSAPATDGSGKGHSEATPQCNACAPPMPTTLFCIPHAGGSAAYYAKLTAALPEHVRLHRIELPGRGRRHKERLQTDLTALVADIMAHISPVATTMPYALFGHSMGGLLAYLCAQHARAEGLPLPRTLFISASATPSNCGGTPVQFPARLPAATPSPQPPTLPGQGSGPASAPTSFMSSGKWTPDALWDHVIAMGGVPECVAVSEEFSSYLKPILHADVTAVMEWQPDAQPVPVDVPLDVPIVAYRGTDDVITEAQMAHWEKLTTSQFKLLDFPGNHFYLQNHWALLATHMAHTLRQVG